MTAAKRSRQAFAALTAAAVVVVAVVGFGAISGRTLLMQMQQKRRHSLAKSAKLCILIKVTERSMPRTSAAQLLVKVCPLAFPFAFAFSYVTNTPAPNPPPAWLHPALLVIYSSFN